MRSTARRWHILWAVALALAFGGLAGILAPTILAQGDPTATPNVNWVHVPEGINVRGGPGFGYGPVGALPVGAWVQPLARSLDGNWVLISYLYTQGWVQVDGVSWRLDTDALPVMAVLSPTPIPRPLYYSTPGGPTYTPNANWVDVGVEGGFVRAGPGQGYAVLGTVFTGDVVDPVAHDAAVDWVLIRFGDGYGWIRYDLVAWAEPIEPLPVVEEPFLTPSFTAVPPRPSATRTPTASATPSATRTSTPSHTPSPSLTPSPTDTPTPTDTASPTPTATPSPTDTVSPTASPTVTPGPTETPAPSATPTATRTATVTPSATATVTPSPTVTASATATVTPSRTITPTATATATVTPSPVPSATPTPSASATPSPQPTATPSPSATASTTAAASPTALPPLLSGAEAVLPAPASPTETPSPSPTLTATSSHTPTLTPTPTHTASPTATSTSTATAIPSPQPSPTPSPATRHSPTPVMLALPTDTPTLPPTATASLTPTETSAPTVSPTVTPGTTPLAVAEAGQTGTTGERSPENAPTPESGRNGTPLELIAAGILAALAALYAVVYVLGAANLTRYREGFVVTVCPICARGTLSVEERRYRALGIPRVRRVVRCSECRSVLRQVGRNRWRYAVDAAENPAAYQSLNNRVLTEHDLLSIAPELPPEYIEGDEV